MNAQPRLDLDFVRSQFPAFAEPSLQGQAFFENAGGSYACAQVIGLLNEYYRRLKVQPYYSYPAATEAGQWMDRAHVRLGDKDVSTTMLYTHVLHRGGKGVTRPSDRL